MTKPDIGVLWELIERSCRITGRQLEEWKEEDFEDVFRLANLKPSSFKVRKSQLKEYLKNAFGEGCSAIEELSKIRYRTVDQHTQIGRNYFKDIQHVKAAIVQLHEGLGVEDRGRSDTAFAAMCLGWSGLRKGEAAAALRASFSVRAGRLYLPERGETLQLEPFVTEFLAGYITSEGIETRCRETFAFVPYCDTNRILRTTKLAKLDENGITNAINYLSRRLEFPKKFSYEKIYTAGQFHRLHLYELEHPGEIRGIAHYEDIPEETKALCEEIMMEKIDQNQTLKYKLVQYHEWVKCFYPEENNRG